MGENLILRQMIQHSLSLRIIVGLAITGALPAMAASGGLADEINRVDFSETTEAGKDGEVRAGAYRPIASRRCRCATLFLPTAFAAATGRLTACRPRSW